MPYTNTDMPHTVCDDNMNVNAMDNSKEGKDSTIQMQERNMTDQGIDVSLPSKVNLPFAMRLP